jgi:peroxiredoxin Q/BCP
LGPDEGDPAPDFTLPTDDGGSVRLSGVGGPAVVYFYPRDNTPGCTLEARTFTQLKPQFDAAGVAIIGISPDSVKRHASFKEKCGLGITLAADEDRSVVKAYGAWGEKMNYGRKYLGVERSTFLVDADGRVAKVWRRVKVRGHGEAVLAAAKALPPRSLHR